MHSFWYLSTAALIALPFTAAQSLQDLQSLPQCAQQPAETAFAATGCGLGQPACVCKNAGFQSSLTNEVMKDCSQTDQLAVLKFSTDFCAKAGITVNVPQTTALNSAPAAASSAPPPPPPASSSAPPPPPPASSSAPPPASSSAATSASVSVASKASSSTLSPTASSAIVSYNGSNSSTYGGTVLSFTGAAASISSAPLTLGFFSVMASALVAFML